jgi:putative redox protein
MSTQGPVTLRWLEGLRFAAQDQEGNEILVESPEEGKQATAFTPKRLLLASVGACSAVDVAHILRKMREPLEGLTVEVKGQQRDDYPKYFEKIWIRYVVKGKVRREAVEQAIRLSLEKYCSVGATVAGRAQLLAEYEIL